MKHYTYLIQHKTTDKRYIGVRSCDCEPIEDTSYWGSSKYLPEDAKITHVKIILKIHLTRQEAVAHEIMLHHLNNVAVSDNYYNKACQTSIGFDTSGTTISAEHKQKCSNSLRGKHKPEGFGEKISKALKGKTKTLEHIKNLNASRAANKSLHGIKNGKFVPWCISTPTVTHLFYDITMHDKALQDGLKMKQYVSLAHQSRKSGLPIQKGKFKGYLIAPIPKLIEDIV